MRCRIRRGPGKVTYSSTQLTACLADISTTDCAFTGASLRSQSASCHSIGAGPEAAGGPCEITGNCVAGEACIRQIGTCGGTCALDIASGPCGAAPPPLALGYFCDDGGASPTLADGSPCSADADCTPPDVCRGAPGNARCALAGDGGTGATCAGAHDCALSFRCVKTGRGTSAQKTCEQRHPVGQPCTITFDDGGSQPSPGLCQEHEYCDPQTFLCTSESSLGDPCAPDGGDPSCLIGGCQTGGSGSQCALLADDSPCAVDGNCLSAFCVRPDGGQGYCATTCQD